MNIIYDCYFCIISFLNYKDLRSLKIVNTENNLLIENYIKNKINLISNVFINYKYNKNIRKKMKHKYSLTLLRFKPFLIYNIIENSYIIKCKKFNTFDSFIDLIIKLLGNKKYQLTNKQYLEISNYFDKKLSFTNIKDILKKLNTEQLLRIC